MAEDEKEKKIDDRVLLTATDNVDVIKKDSSWCKYLRNDCQQIRVFFFLLQFTFAVSIHCSRSLCPLFIIRSSILWVSMLKLNSIFFFHCKFLSCSVRKVYWHCQQYFVLCDEMERQKPTDQNTQQTLTYFPLYAFFFNMYLLFGSRVVSGDRTWWIILLLLFIEMTQL